MESKYHAIPKLLIVLFTLSALNVQCTSSSQEMAKVVYEGNDEIFPNPERGFYVHHNWTLGGAPLDQLDIVNHGFASPYNQRNAQVILRNTDNPNIIWRAETARRSQILARWKLNKNRA